MQGGGNTISNENPVYSTQIIHLDVDTLFEGKHFFSIFRTFNLKLE